MIPSNAQADRMTGRRPFPTNPSAGSTLQRCTRTNASHRVVEQVCQSVRRRHSTSTPPCGPMRPRQGDGMQLVFVHGVATRREPDVAAYEKYVADRRGWFSRVSLEGAAVDFHDPYWGGEGPGASRTFQSVPRGLGTTLSLGGNGLAAAAIKGSDLGGTALRDAARSDFAGTLNTVAIALVQSGELQAEATASAIGDLVAGLEGADGTIAAPAWVHDPAIRDDQAFLERLRVEVGEGDGTTLGLGDLLRGAGRRVLGSAIGLVDGPVERLARDLSPGVARFLGDVFVYLQEGARRDAIRRAVAADLVKAAIAAASGRGPLVVVGHSMGGVILHDMLSDADLVRSLAERIGAPLSIDLMLTVGTQIGLFQELGLFEGTAAANPAQRPASVRRWWHVYNVMDVLSFGVNGVFGGVDEFSVNTRANIVDAHGAYFVSHVFHKRLARRLRTAGLLA